MTSIIYNGGRPDDGHKWFVADLGYAARTEAEIMNVVTYFACRYLIPLNDRQLDDGAYSQCRVGHLARGERSYYVVRGYKEYFDGQYIIEIIGGPNRILMTIPDAVSFMRAMEKKIPMERGMKIGRRR